MSETQTRKPRVRLTYTRAGASEGTDITEDSSEFLTSVVFTDRPGGASPDIDIAIEDSTGLWHSDWFPSTKDKISLQMYYEGAGQELDAGTFEIDDLQSGFTQQGDSLRIGCQATPLSKNLRQERSQEYEEVTLKAIATEIAGRQSLSVVGKVVDVTFERLTQNEESDIEFLQRISEEFGQLFKIEGDRLIVYNWSDLESEPAQFTWTRADITGFSPRKKLEGIYKAVEIAYEKSDDEEEIKVTLEAASPNNSEDILTFSAQVEDGAQAELKAKEKLRKANSQEYSGKIDLEGEVYLRSGITFNLEGFGVYDGKWISEEVRHTFSRNSGWSTSIQTRRINAKS